MPLTRIQQQRTNAFAVLQHRQEEQVGAPTMSCQHQQVPSPPPLQQQGNSGDIKDMLLRAVAMYSVPVTQPIASQATQLRGSSAVFRGDDLFEDVDIFEDEQTYSGPSSTIPSSTIASSTIPPSTQGSIVGAPSLDAPEIDTPQRDTWCFVQPYPCVVPTPFEIMTQRADSSRLVGRALAQDHQEEEEEAACPPRTGTSRSELAESVDSAMPPPSPQVPKATQPITTLVIRNVPI
eukprot:CAMPEP_0115293338 /NCGR_PEP_ID=MMETSP0270-20121206/65608_1 /TAXON_ID=71861 /ORGANISM="Scrippsiella trochoidea, Strain CCMP3099" /LENGTH=234 /DNA_ID=CAMNT_0002710815 /DNA_START=92 /DNA_END=794 /DNA_ORIENTATION=-